MKDLKKFLVVLARGVEGCGCTKIGIEFTNYVNTLGNGYEAQLIANNDKKWGREDAHKHNTKFFSFATQLEDIKTLASAYDAVVIMSVPAKKFPDASKDGVMAFVQWAKANGKSLIYEQFDHKIQSISRNFYAEDKYFSFFENFDLVCNHSYTNDFAMKYIKKHDIKLKKLICRDEHVNNLFGIDFNALKPFWKSYDQKEMKTIKFIGRSAGWKGPWKFRDLHDSYFKCNGYISTIEGIELSIGVLPELYKSVKPDRIPRDDVKLVLFKPDTIDFNNGKYVFERNMPAYVLPPYNHDEAMERLSKCQFAIELIMMDDNLSKDIIENAMMEMVAVGTIPVFRKKWAQLFTIDGKSLYDYGFKTTGTIFLDEENPEKAIEAMNILASNKDAYEKYRQIAFDFYKNVFDNTVIYKNMLNIFNENC